MTAQGVYSAQVLESHDPENLGRVQVRVSGLDDPNNVLWARVATSLVGPLRSTGFTPAPGDEVVVAFDRGDMRAPIVIGGLWNGKDKPPENNSTKGSERKPVPSAAVRGDFAGKNVTLETPGGQRIRLADSPNTIQIEDASGNSVTLSPSGITINAAAKVTIAASAVEINAGIVTVNAGVAQFSGVVKCDRLIAGAIVGPVQPH